MHLILLPALLAQCSLSPLDAQIKFDAPGAMHWIRSVSVSRDPGTVPRCLLGAPGDDFGAICCLDYGSAYLFEKEDNSWKTNYLKASDFAIKDHFGSAVAIWGDTAFIGSDHDDESEDNSGSVYVFERTASSWIEKQKLVASDPGPHIHFGVSVALSSDVAVIGATKGNQATTAIDAVYVFERQAGVWVETAKLIGSDAGPSDNFGYSVAISEDGESLLAGAFRHPFPSQQGAVYVFERLQGVWVETAKLAASDGADLEAFGASVSISGNTALIGKPALGFAAPGTASAAYVFEKAGGSWVETAKLANPSAATDEFFGGSVSIEGNTALIGATASGFTGESVRGSAYVFERKDPGTPGDLLDDLWIPQAEIGFNPKGSTSDLVEFVGAAVSAGKGLLFVSSQSTTVSGYGYLYSVEDLEAAATMQAQPSALSLSVGGKQFLSLATCPPLVGSSYFVAGSISGISPGIPIATEILPLNPDPYFFWTLTHPNQFPLEDSWKGLDLQGEGSAVFNLPLGLPASFVGAVVNHAFVAFSPQTGEIQAVSNPASLALFP